MKTTSGAMDTALAGSSLTLARCYVIQRRDATTFRFTDHDIDIEISGMTGYEAVLNGTYDTLLSPSPSQIETDMELNVDNMEIQGPMAVASIDVDDIDAGLFGGADIWIFCVDWGSLGSGVVRLRKGKVGEIQRFDDQYLFEVRGATQRLHQELVELYTAYCAADLGDVRCKVLIEGEAWQASTAYAARAAKDATNEQGTPASIVRPISQNDRWFVCTTAGTTGVGEPSWNTTLGATTADGSVVWTAVRARQMAASIASVTSQREFVLAITTDAPDAFFTVGHLEFITGPNAGLIIEIKEWDLATKTVICSLTFPFTVSPAEVVWIYAGCDKQRATCKDPFDNIRNYRGFPDIPGQDEAFRTPNAPEGG